MGGPIMGKCGRCGGERTSDSYAIVEEMNPSNGFNHAKISIKLCDKCAAKVRAFVLNPYLEAQNTNPNLVNELNSICL